MSYPNRLLSRRVAQTAGIAELTKPFVRITASVPRRHSSRTWNVVWIGYELTNNLTRCVNPPRALDRFRRYRIIGSVVPVDLIHATIRITTGSLNGFFRRYLGIDVHERDLLMNSMHHRSCSATVARLSTGATSKISTSFADAGLGSNWYAFAPPLIWRAIPDGHTSSREPLQANLCPLRCSRMRICRKQSNKSVPRTSIRPNRSQSARMNHGGRSGNVILQSPTTSPEDTRLTRTSRIITYSTGQSFGSTKRSLEARLRRGVSHLQHQ